MFSLAVTGTRYEAKSWHAILIRKHFKSICSMSQAPCTHLTTLGMGVKFKHSEHRPTFSAEVANSNNTQCVCGKKLLVCACNSKPTH
jgi:hypothetical protein